MCTFTTLIVASGSNQPVKLPVDFCSRQHLIGFAPDDAVQRHMPDKTQSKGHKK